MKKEIKQDLYELCELGKRLANELIICSGFVSLVFVICYYLMDSNVLCAVCAMASVVSATVVFGSIYAICYCIKYLLNHNVKFRSPIVIEEAKEEEERKETYFINL